MTAPRFMLLDEPFSGIDPISVSDLKKIISGLRKKVLAYSYQIV